MANMFDTNISIEKMAAYLDGNLSDNEMSIISNFIEKSEDLKMFVQVNNCIDEEVSEYNSQDLELPLELQSLDFELPEFNNITLDFDSPSVERDIEQDISICESDSELREKIPLSAEENVGFENQASNLCNCSIDTTRCENAEESIDLANHLDEPLD